MNVLDKEKEVFYFNYVWSKRHLNKNEEKGIFGRKASYKKKKKYFENK